MSEVNNNQNQLTEKDVELINETMAEAIEGTVTEKVVKFPSNNGVETVPEEDREKGELKIKNITINSETGENVVLDDTSGLDDTETFEEMCARIDKEDIDFEPEPLTEEDISTYIKENNEDNITNNVFGDIELSPESIKVILDITNRKIKKEEFNIYKSFPQEVQEIINKYVLGCHLALNSTEGKTFRNMISEQLIAEFISNITIDKTMNDFNKEIESIFAKGSEEIADAVVGYTVERNKKYREYADSMEDEDKKQQIIAVLDAIDDAYSLDKLKEFAKRCKIKRYDLENPFGLYDDFLRKYANSKYNIYDIKLTRPILSRALNQGEDSEAYSEKDVDAFLVCYCKYCLNMKPDNVLDHAFMYYVMYNIVFIDVNVGENKEISDTYIENIKEVISNLRLRNNNFK